MKKITYLNTGLSIFFRNLQNINKKSNINLHYPGEIKVRDVFLFKDLFKFIATDDVENIASQYMERTYLYRMDSKLESNKLRINKNPDFNTYYMYKDRYLEYSPAMLNFLFLFIVDPKNNHDRKLQILLHFIQDFKEKRFSLLMFNKLFGTFIQSIQYNNKILSFNNSGYRYNINKIAKYCTKYHTYDKSNLNIVKFTGLTNKKEKDIVNDFQNILDEILAEKELYDSSKYIQKKAKEFLKPQSMIHHEKFYKHEEFTNAYYTSFITTLAIAKIWSTHIDTTIKVECSILVDNFIKNLYILVDDTISPKASYPDKYINSFSHKEKFSDIGTNKEKARTNYFNMLKFFELTTSSLYTNEVKITNEQIQTTIENFKNIRNQKNQSIRLEFNPIINTYIPKLLDFILHCSVYLKRENLQIMLKSGTKEHALYKNLDRKALFDIVNFSKFQTDTNLDNTKIYQYSYLLIITFFKTKYKNIEKDENVNFLKNMMLHITRTSKITVKKHKTSTVKPVYLFQYLSDINNK